MKIKELFIFSVVNEKVDQDQRTAPPEARLKIYTIWDIPPGSWWDKETVKSHRKHSGDSLVKRFCRFVLGGFR